jgi:hypothetical protein
VLTFIHSRLALTIILFALILGVWAAWNYFRRTGLTSSYWGALIIGEMLMLAQGLLGVLLVVSGEQPADWVHFLYGVLTALGLPAVYIYTGGRATRIEAGLYALVSFFIFGLALRAIMTGG